MESVVGVAYALQHLLLLCAACLVWQMAGHLTHTHGTLALLPKVREGEVLKVSNPSLQSLCGDTGLVTVDDLACWARFRLPTTRADEQRLPCDSAVVPRHASKH